MTTTSWLLLLSLVGDIIGITEVSAQGQQYEKLGIQDPWTEILYFPQRKESLPDSSNLVALIPGSATREGDLFAFTARIYNTQPFYFQVWRPTSSGSKSFQLVANHRVTPSVTPRSARHEDFYLLGDQCIHVQREDRLGLFFDTVVPPVYYGQSGSEFSDRPDPNNPPLSALPQVGKTIPFVDSLTVKFVATGFVLVNNAPTSGARVNCTNGLIIDHAGVTRIVPTTTPYTPPTGIPGNTGAIGPQGNSGSTGEPGDTGHTGYTGSIGDMGPIGRTGETGDTGANNYATGAIGATGATGRRGETGESGATGIIGDTGEVGPRGLHGDNHTIILYGPHRYRQLVEDDDAWPSDERWWASTMAIQVVYIWAAVATFVLLVTLIVIVVVCCQTCPVKQALKKSN